MPPQFKVDELPDPVQLESPYGSYRAEWKSADDTLSFEQRLEVKDITAPASQYAAIREFFEKVAGGQHEAAVLINQ